MPDVMVKVVLFVASSLDGYIARENGDVDWLPENTLSGYGEFYKTVDAVILGKKTYDQVLGFGKYPYGDKKSYIFTRTKGHAKDENVEYVSDANKLTKDVVSKPGKNIWLVGGAELISLFMNNWLVDEIILSIIPVVLGKGIPLFKNVHKEAHLELIKITNYDKLVELHYKILKQKLPVDNKALKTL